MPSKLATISGARPERAGQAGGAAPALTALGAADLSARANAASPLAVISGAIGAISDICPNSGTAKNGLCSTIEN